VSGWHADAADTCHVVTSLIHVITLHIVCNSSSADTARVGCRATVHRLQLLCRRHGESWLPCLSRSRSGASAHDFMPVNVEFGISCLPLHLSRVPQAADFAQLHGFPMDTSGAQLTSNKVRHIDQSRIADYCRVTCFDCICKIPTRTVHPTCAT